TEGEIKFDGADISALATDATARAGIFLSQQITPAIPGLSISTLLKNAANAAREKPLTAPEFFALAKTYCELLDIPSAWLARDVGVGFSGGEKKRLSMLEMLFANPKLAILDEPDSGVDISSIDIIIKAIEYQRAKGTRFVVISHYPKLIDALKPDAVHVIEAGKIARSGGHLLAKEIEKNGF
ncbi:MAG: ATP-binding cassette domain-containing protein, partial [Alphaproteobacteria bacterium]|nr:ATP-binding cassette domain-containing protein [Alphaproteobacteria bacterium]